MLFQQSACQGVTSIKLHRLSLELLILYGAGFGPLSVSSFRLFCKDDDNSVAQYKLTFGLMGLTSEKKAEIPFASRTPIQKFLDGHARALSVYKGEPLSL